MTDRRSFGEWLRRERERRSITIRSIAERTKIGSGLLESLERGDISRWPEGIYRRAFVRAYADTVGLDVDLVLANFERLFTTADERGAALPADVHDPDEPELRLQLADPGAPIDVDMLWGVMTHVGLAAAFGAAGFVAAGPIGMWAAVASASLVHHVVDAVRARRRAPGAGAAAAGRSARPAATVVNFSDEQRRSTSKRGRARRMVAGLSAAAIPAASTRRRRAARS
jgi:transcriptional regulator with XRE-family HTH domain